MTPHTDLLIPSVAAIISRAQDTRESAVRLQDAASVRQLDRLIDKAPHAVLCWQLGVLIVGSPSGAVYQVSRAGCDCLNGQRSSKRQCWHVTAYELLLDLLETESVTADRDADEGTDDYIPTNDAEDRYNRGGW